ncbi:histidine kinase [Listeria newyorkensis]|uniref:Histidine kinase n=1 Tax=Listeria newyorkensis TaxID=1497681 RepID=A0ABX4XP35_9LIST|nr:MULTISPECIES: KdpD-like non-kinase potassium sensor [Listeria]KGL39436.1 histidine kinase [Listeriaceae bacterium FSL A5-0209]KGL46468.1 histidine kinase [Listeria newyorkensis]KMT63158.1 Osmosensitive K+ channel histidine kinase KdpD [Listeria newyorkensis]PNP92994.1 histidine kinase [Listeria newyorkensis]RQW66987.1 sensor histidine kinase KdpD [Listeria sp. SHR_NRA_18]
MSEEADFSFRRKSPEEILAEIERLKKGKLKIYIGSAPGVGKTYRMLSEAQDLRKEGIDVVIGLVETHNRPETAAMIGNLETIPLKEIPYKGTVFQDLDVEAILARNPDVVVIDELAHTNIPGSKHSKRYQDVLEILDHRINVLSAVNIQHLESLHDAVQTVTGVKVRERIPDHLLDTASEVILIDVSAETLQKRLREGKIYASHKINQSLENFFTQRNLSALREMALREVADDVDDKTDKTEAKLRAAAVNEKILVCVKNDDNAEKLIRRGWRIANRLRAELFILTAIPGSLSDLDPYTRKKYESWKKLANEFDAHFLIETNHNRKIFSVITEVAKKHHITQIILGQSVKTRLEELTKGSVVNAIMRETDGIDIHIVADSRKN